MGKAFLREMELKNNRWPLTLHLAALGLKLGCVTLDKQRNYTTFCCESLLWPRRIIWMCLKSRGAQGRVRKTSTGGGNDAILSSSSYPCDRCALQTLSSTFPSVVSSLFNIFLCPKMCPYQYIWQTTGYTLTLGVVTWVGGPVSCFCYGVVHLVKTSFCRLLFWRSLQFILLVDAYTHAS